MERLEKQLAFLLELDKEKLIGRQTYLSDGSRKENDAEHAWHLAVMTLILAEYANEPIDVARTVAMVLFHDVVEVLAGDTYAYDEEGKKTQKKREEAAAKKLYGMLPTDQGTDFYDLWEEFEAGKTPEARFAHTMDNFQPVMLTAKNGGKSWKEHDVRLDKMMERQKVTPEGSQTLWEYEKTNWLEPYVRKGIIHEEKETHS